MGAVFPQRFAEQRSHELGCLCQRSCDGVCQSILAKRKGSATQLPREPHSLVVSDLDNTLTGCKQGAQPNGRLPDAQARVWLRCGQPAVRQSMRSVSCANGNCRTHWAWITSTGSEIYWQRGDGLIRDAHYSELIAADWDPATVGTILSGIEGLTPQPGV